MHRHARLRTVLATSLVALASSTSAHAQTTWTEEAQLTAPESGVADAFGWCAALDGDTALLGAPSRDVGGLEDAGAAYVVVRDAGSWTTQAYLLAGGLESFADFGTSVALAGDTALVGAPNDDVGVFMNAGSAFLFTRSGASWSSGAVLQADQPAAIDDFGRSVALSEDLAVVGARLDDHAGGVDAGSAYVFARDGGAWEQEARLSADDAADNDGFGNAVSLSGDTLLVAAAGDDHAGGTDAGSVYVFVHSGTTWSQQARLAADDAADDDGFGWSVALSGDTALVGAPRVDHAGGADAGAAFVFVRSGGTWDAQARLVADDGAASDGFGWSVSLEGDTAVVGARVHPHDGGPAAGAAYVFARSGSTWSQRQELRASDGEEFDRFGSAVALSGDSLVVAAERDHVAGLADAGSAYAFVDVADPWTDLGGGTPGVAGTPTLTGSGPLTAGSTAAVTLADAPPGAALVAWVSFAPTPFAALGGTVHAFPFATQLVVTADGAGAFTGSTTWPPGVAPGTEVWFQFVVEDATTVHGLTLSDGLLATTP